MTDLEKLKEAIKESGITMSALSRKSGISRATIYNRLAGIGEFTASEIVALAFVLHLDDARRDDIFLSSKLHAVQH
ncbi:MAG: helix-turn-helix transcriptional regulator [Aeriscardovia sp.]|nr:helix-turn-helix transcriptional regulator [Aeriscardovia sp.]